MGKFGKIKNSRWLFCVRYIRVPEGTKMLLLSPNIHTTYISYMPTTYTPFIFTFNVKLGLI